MTQDTEMFWLTFEHTIDKDTLKQMIVFKKLSKLKPDRIRCSEDLFPYEDEVVLISLPKGYIKHELELHTTKLSLEDFPKNKNFTTVAETFLQLVWPTIKTNIEKTIEYKRESMKTDYIFCVLSQTSGAFSMDDPRVEYIGLNCEKMWSAVSSYLEDFKSACESNDDTHKYVRYDTHDVFDTWEDFLESFYKDLVENDKLVIDGQDVFNTDEPCFLYVYMRKNE